MNLHRAYLLFAAFYTALVAVGIIALMGGGGSPVILIQIGVGALAVTGLWGFMLGKGFMSPRIWRPLGLFLAVGVVAQVVYLFTASPSGTVMAQLMIGIVFSVYLVWVLYVYGDRDRDWWATSEEIQGGKLLDELLTEHQGLRVEKREADRQATVTVTREGDRYRASVIRGQGENEEHFEERFSNPATLAFFIEKYTCISTDDFARQYSSSNRDDRNDQSTGEGAFA